MIYCMSDIHGEIDRFHEMLSLIQFSQEDTLYILGDVIDRTPGGVDLLNLILEAPNMIMLLGNHEQMCLDTLGPYSLYGSRQLWQQNGGSSTYRHLLYISSKVEKSRILRFLSQLPDHLDIEVEGRKFHLVHGMPSDDPHVRLWGRPEADSLAPFEDKTAIIGHTPTCFLTQDFEEDLHIWHGRGIINIDCGCGHKNPNRKLACLRLNDRAEFYV